MCLFYSLIADLAKRKKRKTKVKIIKNWKLIYNSLIIKIWI